MPQVIEVPGHGPVEFPDGMSDDDISAAIKRNLMVPKKEYGWKDAIKPEATTMAVLQGIPRGFGNLLTLPTLPVELLNKLTGQKPVWDLSLSKNPLSGDPMAANAPQQVRDALSVGERPKDVPGRFAAAAGEAIGGGGWAAPAAALRGAMGAEGGALISNDNPLVSLMGGLVAGAGPDAVRAVRNRAESRISEAIKNIPESDLRAAEARQAQGNALGVKMTGPEALGDKNLLSQQRLVENSPITARVMQNFMAERPGQVSNAFGGMLNQFGPAADPMATGAAVQNAATGAITNARQAGNAAARPFYQAAEAQRIPASDWNAMTGSEAVQKALQAVKADYKYGIPKGEPEGSVRWLDAARKWLSDQAQGATQKGMPGAARIPSQAADDINAVVDASVPSYRAARGIVEQNMRQVVEPMERGLTGRLSQTADAPTQFGAVTDPARTRPQQVAATAKDLKLTDPAAYRDLIRTGIQNEFDTAMKVLANGGQEFAGARLARSLRETPQTQANIEAAIRELPNGQTLLKGYNNLLDTLQATGNRLPVGSATAFNELQKSEMTAQGLSRLATNPIGGIGDWADRISSNLTSERLARIFTDPESVKLMRQLAMTNPESAKARALVGALITGEASNK